MVGVRIRRIIRIYERDGVINRHAGNVAPVAVELVVQRHNDYRLDLSLAN